MAHSSSCLFVRGKIAQTPRMVMRRAADFCARYGGEEFAVILPNVTAPGALKVLEEIREAVMTLKIKHEYSAIAPVVTVSVGVATINPANKHLVAGDFLDRADQALYQAKYQGRNQVVLFSDAIK